MMQPPSSYSKKVCKLLLLLVLLVPLIALKGYSGVGIPPLSLKRVKLMHRSLLNITPSLSNCFNLIAIINKHKLPCLQQEQPSTT